MNKPTIADIYSANKSIREHFTATVTNITESEASALPEGEQWTLADLIEHVSIVNGTMSKICAKLMSRSESEDIRSNGDVIISSEFVEKGAELLTKKVEAPDFVRPQGGKSIESSMEILAENTKQFENLRPLFESHDCNQAKFPHPFFGDLSAAEWLVLAGRHESRHTAQIERILEKIRH